MAISIPIISEFDGKGIAKAKQEFSQLEGAGAKANYAIKKAAIPAAAALAGVGAALFDATKAAMEDEAAQKQLALALNKNTKATDSQIAATEDWISTQGRLLGVADDELRPALAKLARQTHDVTKAQEGVKLAMDISKATGKDLSSVTDALAKAYGGNLTALGKLSPELKAMIKDGMTLDQAMAKLSQTFGGAAAEAANTTAGKFARMKLTLDETKESIGAALIPVIEKALPLLQKMSDWAAKHPQAFTAIAGAIGGIAAAVVALNIAMALNPFTLIAAGVVALGAAAVYAYNKFDAFRTGVNFVLNAVITSINAVIRGLNLLPKVNIPTIPHIKESAPKALSGADISRYDIPAMASGGIVTSPTLALIGEAGPEAVVPLDRAGAMGTTVNITVNGGDPQQVVNALRKYMQANGSIPIRVSA